MNTSKPIVAAVSVLAAALGVAACGSSDKGSSSAGASASAARSDLPQGSQPVKLDPANFTTKIDHPYWPMKPGSRWIYHELDSEGGDRRVVVTVTNKTKKIANGIEAAVVHDKVMEAKSGTLVEDTLDWYAQDRDGNIWYLGENTKEYENGKFKTSEGSFEAGVDGAQPGIALPAQTRKGLTYRQEYYKGHAEDNGEIFSVGEQAEVPAGHYKGVVMTKDTTPIEPKVLEFKFYAPGVGPVLELGASGGSDRAELVSYTEGK
jgi:hypothetical protein